MTGTKSLRNIPDPGKVLLGGQVARKWSETRKAEGRTFAESGEETPPGTAGEDAKVWTSGTVTAPCFLPPHQVSLLAARHGEWPFLARRALPCNLRSGVRAQ